MGMVEGPFSKEAAASRCGCASADLCPGPLAGIDEGDKIRTIYDGSVGGANDTIRNQTVERTTAPTVSDGVQALHWLHAAAEEGLWNLHLGVGSGRHQVGAAQGGRHQGPPVNKVGTYGMASAQSYWGRLAALLLRVLYALFPQGFEARGQ